MLAWFAAKVKSVQMICRHFGVSVGSEGEGEKGWDCILQMQLKHKKRYTFVQKKREIVYKDGPSRRHETVIVQILKEGRMG